jgi:hypothetical protein
VDIHCHHNIATSQKAKILLDWQTPEFDGFLVNTQIVAVSDISNVPFADITLQHSRTQEVGRLITDQGFTLGLTMLYFYYGESLQKYIAPIPITKSMHEEYIARQKRKADEAKAAEFQRNYIPPAVEPTTVAPVSVISEETNIRIFNPTSLDSMYADPQAKLSDLDSLMILQYKSVSDLKDMVSDNNDAKTKRRRKKSKDY